MILTKELIIAAYNRDYSWILNIDPSVKTTVYRKGGTSAHGDHEIYIPNNVGRDVHTFFYHIVNRYDSLADFTFFSQDYPFDHVNNYIYLINGNRQDWDQAAILKNDETWFFNTEYSTILQCDKSGAPHHPGLDLCSVWNKIFSEPCPDVFEFVAAGHLCISRQQLHKKPKSFYENIVHVLETDPISPWCIERFESYIFS